jgi:hypothetical protein
MNLESKVANNSRSRNVFLFYNEIYLDLEKKDQHNYLINSRSKLSKPCLGNNHFYAFCNYLKNMAHDDKKSYCWYIIYNREKEYQG